MAENPAFIVGLFLVGIGAMCVELFVPGVVLGLCGAACVVIAVVMTPGKTPSGGNFWVEDCAACVENMLLAIVALGYASVWVEGTLLRKQRWLKDLLGVPNGKRPYVLLPVGHPASPGEMAPKRPLQEIVHYEKHGRQQPMAGAE